MIVLTDEQVHELVCANGWCIETFDPIAEPEMAAELAANPAEWREWCVRDGRQMIYDGTI